MKFFVLHAVPAAALSLLACESVSVAINIDPRNIVDYYQPSQVEVVTYEELGDTPYVVLEQLKGLSLQEREVDLPANEADARTALRRKAALAGGNALVVHKCIRIAGSAESVARSSVTCYGDAIFIDKNDD